MLCLFDNLPAHILLCCDCHKRVPRNFSVFVEIVLLTPILKGQNIQLGSDVLGSLTICVIVLPPLVLRNSNTHPCGLFVILTVLFAPLLFLFVGR